MNGGGQRRTRFGSFKRIGALIAVVCTAVCINVASNGNAAIKAKADTNAPKSVSGTQGNATWSADVTKGILTISPKAGTDGNLGRPGWAWNPVQKDYDNSKSITTINITGRIYATNLSNMFSMFKAVTKINGIENIDTSHATDMRGMFDDCESLEAINLSHFDTKHVTDMNSMFAGCKSITSLDVNTFNTANVTNMAQMFHTCSSLKSLDLSNFNTSKVESMYSMFAYCDSLTSLNIKNFNTSLVNNMENMFKECDSLVALDVSMFNTSKVTNMSCMFDSCASLKTLNLSNFDTSNVTDMYCMFSNIWTSRKSSLTNLNVSSFNTSKVTNMISMFGNLTALTKLNITNFDTHNVTQMNSMFNNCASLKEIDLSHFNTSKVTEMSFMFKSCKSLESLDLSKFDTSHVTKMNGMFNMDDYDHGSLHYINLSSFDTSAAINNIKNDINNNTYKYNNDPFYDMFGSNGAGHIYCDYPFTIVLGSKCNILSMNKNGTEYRLGIQYELPEFVYQEINNRDPLIIKQKENKFGPFDYYPQNDKGKYTNPFADAWKPEMAGTWTVEFKNPPTQYTVTFKDGVTNATISSSKVNAGTKVDLPTPPTHDGYEFVEWQNKDELANVQSDVTVTATYKKIEMPAPTKYTVIFKDGLTNGTISSSTVEAGSNVNVPNHPTHDGYEFVSWINQEKLTNIQSDVTVTAQYRKITPAVKTYSVIFKDGLTDTTIYSTTANEGSTVNVPAAPKHDGYKFISWTNKEKLSNIQSDVTVTAQYRKIEKTDNTNNTNSNANNNDNTNTNSNKNTNINADNQNVNNNIISNAANINNNSNINKPQISNNESDNQSNDLAQTGIDFSTFIAPFFATLAVASFITYRKYHHS